MKVMKKMSVRSAMRVEIVLVLLLPFILLSIFTCAAAVSEVRCKEAEREALLDFKLSFTADPYGGLSSWSTHNPDCCHWWGVVCDDDTGHVVTLLVGAGLQSHQLRPSLLVLQHLTILQFIGNNFTMRIPEFIGSLPNLNNLQLSDSGFYGKIPPHLGNLTHLRSLDFRGFFDPLGLLYSDNLQWLPQMSSLLVLDLSGVNLTTATDWVSSLKRLPSILEFTCSYCSFPLTPQPVPHNHSTSLESLDLSASQISFPNFLCLINGTYGLNELTLASMNQNPNDFFRPLFQSAAWSMLFPMLEILDISENQLSEFISGKNSSATPKLETLYIYFNLMTTIPSFSSLLELDASNNRLINVSLHCSCMQKLQSLDISFNLINTLPDLSKLSSLTYLDASFNSLNIIISDSDFSNISNLQKLDLSYNHLLTFNFSRSWVPPFNLTILILVSCTIGPHFPNWVLTQRNLQYLDISVTQQPRSLHCIEMGIAQVTEGKYNPLYKEKYLGHQMVSMVVEHGMETIYNRGVGNNSKWMEHVGQAEVEAHNIPLISNSSIMGVIPNAFWNGISNLGYLNVSHNKLEGPLPNLSVTFPVNYIIVDFSFNSFRGPIPHFLFSIGHIDLSNNYFSSFSSSQHIIVNSDSWEVNLSNNQLSGPLPSWIFRLNGLQTLNVENNMLTGDIPSSIASSWGLNELHMNNNRFSGELPSSMNNCTQLVILELGNNNFSGSLPIWVGDRLHQLFVLNMRSNIFTGELPSNLCNLQMLQVLDLSGNRLLGAIPDCVDNFTSMTVYKGYYIPTERGHPEYAPPSGYASIMWKGKLEQESGEVLPQLILIDLSSNRLTGIIPSGFTTLKYLNSLDLSNNNLNGSIPDKIGRLTYLEVLKLSSNRLGGEIPQSLADLTFLDALNLSSNNLSGVIPKSTQLQSFDPSSYAGNPKLCGDPLPTLCPWDKGSVNPPSSVRDHAEEGQESFDFEAFYAALGAGFASGLFGILGILHFHAPSRHAFFHMASEVGDWIFIWTMLYI